MRTGEGTRTLHWIAFVLVLIGAINWGLVGLFQVDAVAAIFGGPDGTVTRVVYVLVGIAGIVLAATSTRYETTHHRPVPSAR